MIRGREMRRMLERMGVDLEPIPNVEEVIIKTSDKEIIIKNANVSEVKTKDFRFFQVVGGEVEERQRERPKFSEEDILLVAQQAGVSREKAIAALEEADGEPAKAILKLTSQLS
ncbi:MAG: nascent polypeptide-associated complex protein [Nitrososphaerota archaeon]|nr:nascent polypeptide-associated complex protein [Nitrososphaerales archaeon]MDW8045157.1 nascent polypeptide-associated complex protein [Nitrososphaerota archaeon]